MPSKSSESASWREDENAEPQSKNKQGKSYGIEPTRFHKAKRDRDVEEFRRTTEEKLLYEQKREHLAHLSLKRNAFKKFTDLRIFPTQDQAFRFCDGLLSRSAKRLDEENDEYWEKSPVTSSSGDASVPKKKLAQDQSQASPSKAREREKWESTFRQQLADQLDKEGTVCPLWSMEPRVFSIEKAQGKRKYVAGHFGRIVDLYWRKTVEKHLYEVIREGTPCRMYFDLEYSKQFNKDIDEDQLLSDFKEELFLEIEEVLGLKPRPECLMDLDSSNDKKFSHHWILDLDGLFVDAMAVGRFVKRFIGRLAEEQATGKLSQRRPCLARHLFVGTKEPNKKTCFVDLGVYTRNRLFRVIGSSKFGKSATLRTSGSNLYPGLDLPSTQVREGSTSLDDFITANDWTKHAEVLAATLVVPLPCGKIPPLFTVPDDAEIVRRKPTKERPKLNRFNVSSLDTSPLPALDMFILEDLSSRGGIKGAIRAWAVTYDHRNNPQRIVYQMSRNRFCELIGRPHKSNNIFWEVDLENWLCFQGCHDPDCVGRGKPHAIPQSVLPKILEEYDQWQEALFEQALGALNLDDIQPAQAGGKSTQGESDEQPKEATDLESSGEFDELIEAAVLASPELFP